MKIKETLNFFINLRNDAVKKPEIKIYDKYIGILSGLINRDLTENQIQSIELELETLNLNAESHDELKHFKQKLSEFQKFLKDRLALVSEGYYTSIGAGSGIVIGSIFSILFQSFLGVYSLLIGINGGMILGAMLGLIRDNQAKKQGRVLIAKLDKRTNYDKA